MKLTDFDYHLPPTQIAQTPVEPRDASRLLVLNRQSGDVEHRQFANIIDYLRPGDILVLNQTRVIPARLQAKKAETGGAVEILLLAQKSATQWVTMVGGKNVVTGIQLALEKDGQTILGTVLEELEGPQRIIEFDTPLTDYIYEMGEMPLPPYITAPLDDPERYQTIYARREGSAAAPTAGLHFTGDLLFDLQKKGVKIAYVTLHIGLDTFAPVKEDNVEEHQIHRERAILTPEDAKAINDAKLNGGRIIAVGTTSARTLESAAIRSVAFGSPENDNTSVMQTYRNLPENMCPWRPVMALDEETDLFITPGFKFRAIDAMITNFHLPKSTLLMMISAFAGREKILDVYQTAIEENYRFYSFGDAMFIE